MVTEEQSDEKIREQLAIERYLTARQRELDESFDAAKPPSRFTYVLWGTFASFVDILDFLGFGVGVTGIGLIPVIIIDVIIAAVFIFLGYLAGGKIKKIHRANESIGERISRVNVTKLLKAPEIELPKHINPIRKNTRNSLLQIIPVIDLWPWQMMGVHSLYKMHKEAYEKAQELKAEYEEALAQEAQSLEEAS
ncbi:MAG: hypothetical protein Q8P35_02715 [Candidatus Yanofskybacteria bacterium]|nr:hypothetical protein [Candidatus Yanofskybacteria bacterium]